MKVGDPYDAGQLRRTFQKLWDSGLFEDLSIEKEAAPGGVRLVAVVVERPRVSDLEFRGNKKLTTSQLKDKLKEGKVEIRVGAPVSLRDVSKGKSVLTDAYRAEGFRSAVVDTAIEPMGENERRVVFLVDEGDKIKIDDDQLHREHRLLGPAPLLRDEEDAGVELLPVLGLEGRLQPGELRGRHRARSRRSTRTRATRTSSSRTR